MRGRSPCCATAHGDHALTPETLAAVVEGALGRPLDSLGTAEAIDMAELMRAIVASLPAPNDVHLAARLVEVADPSVAPASPDRWTLTQVESRRR